MTVALLHSPPLSALYLSPPSPFLLLSPVLAFEYGSSTSDVSPLLQLLFTAVENGFGTSEAQPPPPSGFLDKLLKEGDFDSMDPILKGPYEDIRGHMIKVSALGNFQQSLRALSSLVGFPVGAKSLENHPWWIPTGAYLNGRVIEITSILGPLFFFCMLVHCVIKVFSKANLMLAMLL